MPNSNKQQVVAKIRFLEDQLISLDHYLPETYEYLMAELDVQKRQLAEIEVLATYQQIESEYECPEFSSRQSRDQGKSFSRAETRNKNGSGT
jgi:hypothetical protein